MNLPEVQRSSVKPSYALTLQLYFSLKSKTLQKKYSRYLNPNDHDKIWTHN